MTDFTDSSDCLPILLSISVLVVGSVRGSVDCYLNWPTTSDLHYLHTRCIFYVMRYFVYIEIENGSFFYSSKRTSFNCTIYSRVRWLIMVDSISVHELWLLLRLRTFLRGAKVPVDSILSWNQQRITDAGVLTPQSASRCKKDWWTHSAVLRVPFAGWCHRR